MDPGTSPGMSAKPPTPPSFPSHTDSLLPHSLYPVHISSSTVQESDNRNIDNRHQLVPVHHQQMDPNVPPQPRYPSTCIPSLMPPGVDPTSVDFRTFFPYIPNEVKHRKRTSRHQLKVLEEVFRNDTKPNAVLRKKLAAELEMSPRAVQVWFQNRRAKDKALRKRVSAGDDQDKGATASSKKSPSRDSSPIDSSNSSTATEKPTRHAEDCVSSEPPVEQPSSSTALKISCSSPLSADSPWPTSSGTPVDIPPHVRLPMGDQNGQELDPLYGTRRGSLPTVMPSQPLAGPNTTQPPPYYPDRRKSMDVSFYRLMHHPFARIAKEKNEALYLPKSPLSPAGAHQANMARTSPGMVSGGVGPIRTTSHAYTHTRPALAHRASEPHVFAAARSPFPPVPEGGPLQAPPLVTRRFSDNRMFALTSRTLSSPIPGPLPTPDFQFGDPSSVSPSNASPIPGDVESPSVPLQSPEIAQLHRWSFPRSRETDQDTEDSASFSGLSRFGSVASITGSDSSAIYSDVSSSCVAADHVGYDANARRGSCASGSYLEMRLSGLNMTSRSSQGSVNEAHLNAAAALAYRDKLVRQDHPSEVVGGYISPASTASPGGSPHVRHVKETTSSGLRSESVYEYGPLTQVPENEITSARRGSVQVQEPVPHLYVPNHVDVQGPYPTPPSEAGPSPVQSTVQQQHYSHGSNFIPQGQSNFPHSSEPPFVPGSGATPTGSAYPQQQSEQLQYPPEGTFHGGSNAVGMQHNSMSTYAPPANEYTYAAGHGQEPYGSYN